MPAGKLDLTINKRADFQRVITWNDASGNPVDLTGYDAWAQIKEDYDSSTAILTLGVGTGITLGGVAGTITIDITDTQTGAISQVKGRWDLLMKDGSGNRFRLLEGEVRFDEGAEA